MRSLLPSFHIYMIVYLDLFVEYFFKNHVILRKIFIRKRQTVHHIMYIACLLPFFGSYYVEPSVNPIFLN
ncbi:hypothetical protein HMPREF3033_01853 [Veillonellaceae bacterium DNF00751]|nr:hypothetical protein HMPREF3033_01853 [Veillonellaceae bacterium DNF00751]